MTDGAAVEAIQRAVESSISTAGRVVLAVSGGRDSIVLLHAAATVQPSRIAAVAVFDHRSGQAAREATRLVQRNATELGLASVTGHYEGRVAKEAAWREARWKFLRAAALRHNALIATAHTEDDQVETVLMRVLRGAGARGLAGLQSGSGVLRPLLGISRDAVAEYAERQALEWVEDPSNASPAYLRNRVRHDLLPALLRVRPRLRDELLHFGMRAAEWRGEVACAVDSLVAPKLVDADVVVARAALAQYAPAELAVLWPEIAARAGVVLDRRGTSRLTEFTKYSRNGQRIPVSGGAEVVSHRGQFKIRRVVGTRIPVPCHLREGLVVGEWVVRRIDSPDFTQVAGGDLWTARLPDNSELVVRTWRAGDRIIPSGAEKPRRVKRLLQEADIDAARRQKWPVVLVGEEIIWVPGVRRGRAASARHGPPAVLYRFERLGS